MFKPKSKDDGHGKYKSKKGGESGRHYYHQEEDDEKGQKEHGNFDSFGRDAARQIGGLASRTEKRIEKLVASTGLDVKNGSAFGGAVDKFKDHVRAIYPGKICL